MLVWEEKDCWKSSNTFLIHISFQGGAGMDLHFTFLRDFNEKKLMSHKHCNKQFSIVSGIGDK